MTGTFWFAGLLLGMVLMAAALYWLRGALHRFVDDGGLYSSYNGEQPYEDARTDLNVRRVFNSTRRSRRLAFHKA